MREIHVSEITEAIRKLCLEANYVMGDDVRQALSMAQMREVSPLGREVLGQILENMSIAEADRVPMCQDTGTVVVYIAVGQDVHIVGGGFEDANNQGVHEAFDLGYLRKSMVARP